MPSGFQLGEGKRKRLKNWDVKGNEIIHILIDVEQFGVRDLVLLKLQEHWVLLQQPESYFAAQKSPNSVHRFRINHQCIEPPMQKIIL